MNCLSSSFPAAPATADSGLGCRLAAPAAADAASVKAPKAAKAVKYTGATKVIVVKSGDSLGKIAQENGTDVRTIKELNGLKDDRVFIGRKLKVPAEKTVKPFAKKSEAKAATAKKTAEKYGYQVVFYDNDRVADVAQLFQRMNEALVVALMQADAGLVEDVEYVDELRTYLRG